MFEIKYILCMMVHHLILLAMTGNFWTISIQTDGPGEDEVLKWPRGSPDINPSDFFIWRSKQKVQAVEINFEKQLWNRIQSAV